MDSKRNYRKHSRAYSDDFVVGYICLASSDREVKEVEKEIDDTIEVISKRIQEMLEPENITEINAVSNLVRALAKLISARKEVKRNNTGRYENAGNKALKEGNLHFTNNEELAKLSLKVLDTISENTDRLPVKYAIDVLEDAKNIMLQLLEA